MKKIFSLAFILILFLCTSDGAFCEEEINLTNVQKANIQYNSPVKKDTKNLVISDEETLNGIIQLQREKDAEDLEFLWKKTIDNSNLVKFALKKLAIPEDQRRLHSSIMAKSISAIISGAAFLPMLMGQNSLIQSASFSAGRIATGLLNKAETPTETPMTDTELIELAGMIETLQNNLLNSYYNYKNSLIQLNNVHTRMLLANKNYDEAQKSGNQIEILVSSNLYDNLLIEEKQVKQKVWCHQLQIQRLAGEDAIKNLNLYQYALNNELINNEVNKI